MQEKNKIFFSIIIPMYNGENYIDNSMHSIINMMTIEEKILDLVEIIIINDGSKDRGSEKAKEWAKKWNEKIRKDFIRVIDKENGQYGSVINRAIKEAKGKYFKVLDVDDIFDTKCFIEIVQIIVGFQIDIDIVITDFVFDKVLHNKKITYKWNKYFKPYKILKTEDLNYPNSIITMHSIIYRTQFLRDINFKQIEGIYYSDSHYATIPFSQAKKLYYIDIPLYRYHIGRKDQSINIGSMVKNRIHQEKVKDIVIKELFEIEINSLKQKKYAWKIAKNMLEWQSMIISHDKSINNRNKVIYNNLNDLLQYCKNKNDLFAYKIIKKGMLSRIIKLTRGHGIVSIIRIGEKLYARFKLNVMADWE